MGYRFIGLKDVKGTKRVLKLIQGYIPHGHLLSVWLAGRGVDEPTEGKDKPGRKNSTKMIIKNVPFEASKKDIRELSVEDQQLHQTFQSPQSYVFIYLFDVIS